MAGAPMENSTLTNELVSKCNKRPKIAQRVFKEFVIQFFGEGSMDLKKNGDFIKRILLKNWPRCHHEQSLNTFSNSKLNAAIKNTAKGVGSQIMRRNLQEGSGAISTEGKLDSTELQVKITEGEVQLKRKTRNDAGGGGEFFVLLNENKTKQKGLVVKTPRNPEEPIIQFPNETPLTDALQQGQKMKEGYRGL